MSITRREVLGLPTEVTPHRETVMRESHRQPYGTIPADTNVQQIWKSWPFFDNPVFSSLCSLSYLSLHLLSPGLHLDSCSPRRASASLPRSPAQKSPLCAPSRTHTKGHAVRMVFWGWHLRPSVPILVSFLCSLAAPNLFWVWLFVHHPVPDAVFLLGRGFPKWVLLTAGHLPVT